MSNFSFRKQVSKRKIFKRIEYKIILNHILLKNTILSSPKRFILQTYINKFLKKLNINRLKNKCIISTNTRSVSSYYKLARFQLKKLAHLKIINGLIKGSW